MTVAIVDYGSGNLRSAQKAFERAARERGVRAGDIRIARSAEDVRRVERVVVPGVGAFADCRSGLVAIDGMWEALDAHVEAGKPLLGICVGMQLLASLGLEHGSTPGFGWIPGTVVPIEPRPPLKVPHMGWNELAVTRDHPLLEGCTLGPEGLHAYFCHSYHLVPDARADVLLETDYGGPITAMVCRGNVAGAQFHPEKSQELGLKVIGNFLGWSP
ncbi:MAG: imidazole glycerol phosphate synthase subunit HisH [Hyphomicrobiales bacterium]